MLNNKIIKQLLDKLKVTLLLITKYRVFLFVLAFLGAYGYLIICINTRIQSEPPISAIENTDTGVKQLKIDQDAINTIEQLQAQNVQVKALFDAARNNPFSE